MKYDIIYNGGRNMKKKVFVLVFALLMVFSLTACGKSKEKEKDIDVERESKKNQIGYVEGKYILKDLTFTLPDEYKQDGENRYTYLTNENGIMVMTYVEEKYDGTLDDYIKKDKHALIPILNTLEETVINGNTWLKGKSNDNDVLYYIKDGTSIYVIDVAPVFTTTTILNNLITTLENSLYFKQ